MTKIPQVASAVEIAQMEAYLIRPQRTEAAIRRRIRNACMYYLMIDAGLRVGELSLLRRSCVFVFDTVATAIVIPPDITKTKRERTIPMSTKVRYWVQQMNLMIWSQDGAGVADFAFYGSHPTRPLSTRQIENLIAHISLMSIKRKLTPHMLRHTFATRLMRRVNIRVVQTLLGHKSISSTQIYTHPSYEDLDNAINNTESNC